MDVGSTQRFGTVSTYSTRDEEKQAQPTSPHIVEQEPLTDEERLCRAFEKGLRMSPNSAPPMFRKAESLGNLPAGPSVGERLVGRSLSFKESGPALGSIGAVNKVKRTSLPTFMPSKTSEAEVEKPSRKGSLLGRLRPSRPEPEMQNAYVESLLKYDEWLLESTEILANSCKNFSCINLKVPQGVLVGDFSEELFQALGLCLPQLSDDSAKPMVFGTEVLEKDRKSLKNFILQIQLDEIWSRLFHEMVQRRDDKINHRIFLSPYVCKALLMMKTQEEIDKVSMHLMSECTEMERQVRLINIDLFLLILHDERISSLSKLRKSLIDAALKVMVVAIRTCQNQIAFDEMRGNPNRRELAAKWREKAKVIGPDHLSLEGIQEIAKECAFEIIVHPNPEDAFQQNLEYILAHHEKLSTICAVYNE